MIEKTHVVKSNIMFEKAVDGPAMRRQSEISLHKISNIEKSMKLGMEGIVKKTKNKNKIGRKTPFSKGYKEKIYSDKLKESNDSIFPQINTMSPRLKE